jgi:hypothetical protein
MIAVPSLIRFARRNGIKKRVDVVQRTVSWLVVKRHQNEGALDRHE